MGSRNCISVWKSVHYKLKYITKLKGEGAIKLHTDVDINQKDKGNKTLLIRIYINIHQNSNQDCVRQQFNYIFSLFFPLQFSIFWTCIYWTCIFFFMVKTNQSFHFKSISIPLPADLTPSKGPRWVSLMLFTTSPQLPTKRSGCNKDTLQIQPPILKPQGNASHQKPYFLLIFQGIPSFFTYKSNMQISKCPIILHEKKTA